MDPLRRAERDLIHNRLIIGEMDYTDAGLWLHRVSDAAGLGIKQAVFAFRATHSLDDAAWHIRAYGVSSGYLDVWIGAPPSPTYREPYSILDDQAAGPKLLEILEHRHALSATTPPA